MKIVQFELVSDRPYRGLKCEFIETELSLARYRDSVMRYERHQWARDRHSLGDCYTPSREAIQPFNHQSGHCPKGACAFEIEDAGVVYFAAEGSAAYEYLKSTDLSADYIAEVFTDWMDEQIAIERA